MALTPSTSNTVTLANAGTSQNSGTAVFIPELWSDEIIAAYEKSLVLANLVRRMPMTGKKGDTLYIPKPQRGEASIKAAATEVTLQQDTNDRVAVVVDKHYEYSRLIEDIVDVQAMDSLRNFYTSDAGYALALQIDTDLYNLPAVSSYKQIGADGALDPYSDDSDPKINIGGTDVFDALFRNMIQELDDNNVPMDGRSIVIPPSVRNVIMGTKRYVSSDFVSGQPVANGQIGSLYGVDIYVSTNVKNHNGASKDGPVMLMLHSDAFVLAEQMGVRSQTQYKQEYLATLFTSDTLYGVQTLRAENAVAVVI